MQSVSSMHGKKRLAIAAGALLAAGGLITAAAFTDFANLNIGNGTDDSGIGGDNKFNIQVVGTDAAGNPVVGQWQEAATAEGVNINVPGASTITPGDTVSVEIPFRNESPKLSAAITFSLQDRAGHTSDSEIATILQYTVALDADGDGTFESTPVTNGTQAQVNAIDFGTYVAGAEAAMKLSITLPDQGANNNDLQGKVSYVQAHFGATSVQPTP